MIHLLVLHPVLPPPPAPEAVLGSWRDLAETRGDVQAPSESHGTQHSSHGCALGESHGVCGGVQHVVTAPQCQLLWLFIISIFKKKKKKAMVCLFSLCLSCAYCCPCSLGRWVGVGENLFPPWQWLSDLSVSSQGFPPPVLLLQLKIACYHHVQRGTGKEAGTPLC